MLRYEGVHEVSHHLLPVDLLEAPWRSPRASWLLAAHVEVSLDVA